MTIHLDAELQALIREDVERGGAYRSADEFVARAVQMLHEQEQWIAEHRVDIAAQVEHGLGQAKRGELVDGDEAFRLLRARHEEQRRPS